jgi:hypothetical protein
VEESFNKIKTKVINLIRYWERFKLTLPGRITIAKTFLISQLNYIGCFLPVPAAVLDDIQQLIDGFIKKLHYQQGKDVQSTRTRRPRYFLLKELLAGTEVHLDCESGKVSYR